MKYNLGENITQHKLNFNSIYKNIEDINDEFRKKIFETVKVLAKSIPNLDELKDALKSFNNNAARINSIFINYDYPPIDFIVISEVMNYIEMNSNNQEVTIEN
ncbi:hypothetical protein, partial [Staphylococcus xylosus]